MGLELDSCQSVGSYGSSIPSGGSKVHKVKNIKIKDGGGGGGGATYIFTVSEYLIKLLKYSKIIVPNPINVIKLLSYTCYVLGYHFPINPMLQLKKNGDQHPILIAGGGGGLGLGPFISNGHQHEQHDQHGQAAAPFGRQPISGTILSAEAGKL